MFQTSILLISAALFSSSVFAQTLEMPKIKYPAAMVFEGGKGNPWFDDTNANHQAAWRMYICFEKSNQPIFGEVTLDFLKLGSPIENTWQDAAPQGKSHTERLTKVVLNYSYETKLTDDPSTNFGYALGSVNVTAHSQQDWQLIGQAAHHQHGPRLLGQNLDIFDFEASEGSLVQFGQKSYFLNGQENYLSTRLDRFMYSQKDQTVHVIKACENANQPYVLQIGNEITPD